MRTGSIIFSLLACLSFTTATVDSAERNKDAIGQNIRNFALKDFRGKQHSLKMSGGG